MKKPFLHALGAALYITGLVFAVNYASSALPEENLLMPITMLSVFVLSAAVMGFLFVYEPVRLYVENQKQEALLFFAKTVGIFTGFIALFTILLFLI